MSVQQGCEKTVTKGAISKKKLTSYWGVSIPHTVFEHQSIKDCLSQHPLLIPLEHVHSTLLYVGKKDDNPYEPIYFPLEDQECRIHISHYGFSENAMALQVDSILDQRGYSLPSHAVRQHITMALKKGVKAVDSPKCFDCQLVELNPPLDLIGKVKRYFY
jgi:hypothetical protein